MNRHSNHSANPGIAIFQQLFSRGLALENDYLRAREQVTARQIIAPGT
jgi:phage tail protein X